MNIEEKIIKKIQTLSKVKVTINSEIKDLSLDSLDLAELIFEAETEFNKSISDQDLLKIKTVKDIVDIFKE
ncbi:phosphopantetheine-binding protein [Mycoplasmopsis hyopharyngis]|uniref:phosphopantetheine-binding protein n=1 Tax=Mycoplasmopsis hyopharyngis TaxID=29558 RepID=UPI0038739FF0